MRYKNYKATAPAIQYAFSTNLVWFAAAAAYRIAGNKYLKDDIYKYNEKTDTTDVVMYANKKVVRDMLVRGNGWNQEDVKLGTDAMEYWQNATTKILSGTASSYELALITDANAEIIQTPLEIARIASAISAYDRDVKNQDNSFRLASSKYIGHLNEKLSLNDVEVISVTTPKNSDGRVIVHMLHDNNLLLWWADETVATKDMVGKKVNLTGKVKSHRPDFRHNVPTTTLFYVKLK